MMPLGIPQFAQSRAPAGAVFCGVQAVGIGSTTLATVRMRQLAEAELVDEERTWRMVSVATVAVTGTAWFASMLDASRYHQLQGEELAASARHWQAYRQQTLLPPLPREQGLPGPARWNESGSAHVKMTSPDLWAEY